jgi:integrase
VAKHLESVRALFESDLKVGFAGVFLPRALDLKLPGAARSWPWQWVFPGGMSKRVTAHTFRHSYATHLLQMGYDIRTVQELLGYNDVETTMIYTHVLQSMAGKVVSPLDV